MILTPKWTTFVFGPISQPTKSMRKSIFLTSRPHVNLLERKLARISCSSSIRWMKNKPAVANELARHQYWVSGRADGPTVQMRPILWLVKPDPDNCNTTQLKHLLTKQLPKGTQILLEKHRLVCKPDPKNKQVFVLHTLKLLAPMASAWTTKKTT